MVHMIVCVSCLSFQSNPLKDLPVILCITSLSYTICRWTLSKQQSICNPCTCWYVKAHIKKSVLSVTKLYILPVQSHKLLFLPFFFGPVDIFKL